jgi:hypothetical protein
MLKYNIIICEGWLKYNIIICEIPVRQDVSLCAHLGHRILPSLDGVSCYTLSRKRWFISIVPSGTFRTSSTRYITTFLPWISTLMALAWLKNKLWNTNTQKKIIIRERPLQIMHISQCNNKTGNWRIDDNSRLLFRMRYLACRDVVLSKHVIHYGKR